MNKEFTFIIQGPYSPTHLFMVPELKKYGNVILSCYASDLNKIIDAHQYDSIIPNDTIDPKSKGIYNFENIYRQVTTTNNALKFVNTKYTVKFRSDSYYSGISYLTDNIKNNPDKLSTTPININVEWPYQICDHVMGSLTENIKNTFQTAESVILNKDFIYDDIDMRLCPVVLLLTSWLKSKNIRGQSHVFDFWLTGDPNKEPRMEETSGTITVRVYRDYKETIRNNVNILDIVKLTPFYAKSNTMKKSFTDPYEFPIRDVDTYISAFCKNYGAFVS